MGSSDEGFIVSKLLIIYLSQQKFMTNKCFYSFALLTIILIISPDWLFLCSWGRSCWVSCPRQRPCCGGGPESRGPCLCTSLSESSLPPPPRTSLCWHWPGWAGVGAPSSSWNYKASTRNLCVKGDWDSLRGYFDQQAVWTINHQTQKVRDTQHHPYKSDHAHHCHNKFEVHSRSEMRSEDHMLLTPFQGT